jgi:hypothetical protein
MPRTLQVWPMPHKLGSGGAPCYTLAFYFNVGKVEFAWSPRTPNAKPRHVGRGFANPLEWKEVIELIPSGAVLLTRTKRTKLKIEIDL